MERSGDALWLRFRIEGALVELALPGPARPARKDGLWQTTCMEAFIREAEGSGYSEFNFSPSGEWAAYRFSSYREGMAELELENGPGIGLDASEDHLGLEATIPAPEGKHQMALSAVIEEFDGIKSYWALAHPSGKPDFHHPDCFAIHLPAPDNS